MNLDRLSLSFRLAQRGMTAYFGLALIQTPNFKMNQTKCIRNICSVLRWLDWIFLGGYLPSLSINYVATSKDMAKRLPQLYYVKMKISFDLGFIAIRVAMAT